jgi:hypothetical protein
MTANPRFSTIGKVPPGGSERIPLSEVLTRSVDDATRYALPQFGGPFCAAEAEEGSKLRARIADRAGAIGYPAGYRPRQARNDYDRLRELRCKRLSPSSCSGGTSTAKTGDLAVSTLFFFSGHGHLRI